MQPTPADVTLRQAEALVGLEYRAGEFDCMHLAVLAQRVLFGRTVAWLEQAHPRGVRHQAALIGKHCAELASRLGDADAPATGDAVLWTWDDAAGGQGWHIGTLIMSGGVRWALHTSEAMGASVLQRLADLPAQGLRLEGFYRWRVC